MSEEKSDESGYPRLMRAFADQEEEIERLKADLASVGIINDHVRAEFVSEIRRLKAEVNTLDAQLSASNATVDMLYERSGRFAAQADKYEQELKAAKEEKEEAIRLGDERLAELWDMKQKEIQSLKAEIIRLRRHLGEIE